MPSKRLSREYDLFLLALDQSPDQRDAFLKEQAGGDLGLISRVDELLRSHDVAEASEPLESPPETGALDAPRAIGPYEIRSRLGEGGMGIVYAAEQLRPIQRHVAVKLLKWGHDSTEILSRFDAERQALAMMSHPNIARIVDAGVHQDRPYFVMELIAGVPITAYCDRRGLSIVERLELFLLVCDAVQHAHQKGIIHRDLKPSNVLVAEEDGVATPKVIDFGIAKALAREGTEQSALTELGRVIGTPDYMSPEQADASSNDIDTRSDVYSLGALLYELLCGSTVFGLFEASAGLDEIRRVVTTKSPQRASDRLQSDSRSEVIASSRSSTPEALSRLLRQELDWIIHRALEKERNRRYSSASELAADVHRFLDGDVVVARPPSTSYRVRKFMRRNRGAVAAFGVVAVAIATATGTSILAAVSSEGKRQEAERRAEDLERIADFEAARLAAIDPRAFGETIQEHILDQDPDATRDQLAAVNFTTVAMRAIDDHLFEPTIVEIDRQFESEPGVQATLLQSVASTMGRLGLAEDALRPQRRAVQIRTELFGSDSDRTAESNAELAGLLRLLGQFEESETRYRDAISVLERQWSATDPRLLTLHNELGLLLLDTGQFALARAELERALAGFQAAHGASHSDTVKVMNDLGLLLVEQGEHDEAVLYLSAALEGMRETHPAGDERLLAAITNVGGLLIMQGNLVEGAPLFAEALEGFRISLGNDHPTTLTMAANMGYLKQELGDFEQAERFYLESLEGRRRVLGEDHADTLNSEHNLANLYIERGTPELSETLLLHVVSARRQSLGDNHPGTINSVNNLANLYRTLERPQEALQLTDTLISTAIPTLPRNHSVIGSVWREHALALLSLEQFDAAADAAKSSYQARLATYGDTHPTVTSAIRLVATVYESWAEAAQRPEYREVAEEWRSRLAEARVIP